MSKITKGLFSSNTDLWATPQSFFDELNKEFHFDLDPCALPTNAKCADYYTPDQDGLQQDWGGAQSVLQPSVRQANRAMGAQVLRRVAQGRHSGCYAHTSANGYILLSRLHLPQGRTALYSRTATFQRCQARRTVSLNGSNL